MFQQDSGQHMFGTAGKCHTKQSSCSNSPPEYGWGNKIRVFQKMVCTWLASAASRLSISFLSFHCFFAAPD